jgi:hypothetical protein
MQQRPATTLRMTPAVGSMQKEDIVLCSMRTLRHRLEMWKLNGTSVQRRRAQMRLVAAQVADVAGLRNTAGVPHRPALKADIEPIGKPSKARRHKAPGTNKK